MEGLSAYEVWLAEGNIGTQDDFLESLKVKGDKGDRGEKGEKGDSGQDGKDGFLGKESGVETDIGRIVGHAIGGAVAREVDAVKERLTGKDGKDGRDGKDGKDGRDGIDGKNGKDGLDGKNGLDGKDGRDGKDGKQGPKGDKGDKGDDGKSAYQSWLDSGNKGSEEDYHQHIAKAAAYWGGVILGPNRGGSALTVKDEGTTLTNAATSIDFVGSGVTATNSGGNVTITIPGGGGIVDGDKGDITVTGSGATWTIDNSVVTFAKMQNIPTSRLLGRYSASTGDIQEIQLGTNVSFVGDTLTVASYPPSGAAGDVQFADGLGGFASNPTFNYDTGTDTFNVKIIATDTLTVGGSLVAVVGENLSSFTNDVGYITGNQSITLSGDVSGTGSTSISVTIGNDKVTFAKMQNIATSRILGRTTAGTGDIEELPIGAGIATFLATPSSANLASAVTDETGSGALVFANSPTLVTPALGTPSSGTLTNCTGLPVSGITSSTSTALGVGSLELGNASDTTLSRSAAGVLAVEGVVIPSISSTNTLTNKRITKRVGTTTSSATPTINTDNVDYYSLTAQTVDITSFTTNLSGTPTDNQTLWISITGTAARAITWGSSFESSTVTLPTTTVSTDRLDVGFVWNAATSKWRCVAVA